MQFSRVLSLLALAGGCTELQSSVDPSGAPQQLVLGGKQDGPSIYDPRLLHCRLEYEAFAPTFATVLAAELDSELGELASNGAYASDERYRLDVFSNPTPTSNLSFIVQVSDASGRPISYAVLPPPEVEGAFLFELGAAISPVELFGPAGLTTFDFVRAYCSLRDP